MNPSFSNIYNLEDSADYPNTQYYDNSQFFSNPSQIPVTESPHTSQGTQNESRTNKWEVAEDVALMSAWCLVSEDAARGKNQKKEALWARVKVLYDATQAENPGKLGMRNANQMKGRFTRLSQNAQKWVAAYQEAYRRGRSGMSQKDIEREAHIIYEQGGKGKFLDSVVFNDVMCKHPKWELQLSRDTTRTRPECEEDNEESGGSVKRSRTTEEGEYSNPETPKSVSSTIQRPIGRDATKKKGKGKVATEFVEELRALTLTRGNEVDVIQKRIELEHQKEQKRDEREQKREERERKKEERDRMKEERDRIKEERNEELEVKKMQLLHLNTLLQRTDLTLEEENMKRFLISKFYGN